MAAAKKRARKKTARGKKLHPLASSPEEIVANEDYQFISDPKSELLREYKERHRRKRQNQEARLTQSWTKIDINDWINEFQLKTRREDSPTWYFTQTTPLELATLASNLMAPVESPSKAVWLSAQLVSWAEEMLIGTNQFDTFTKFDSQQNHISFNEFEKRLRALPKERKPLPANSTERKKMLIRFLAWLQENNLYNIKKDVRPEKLLEQIKPSKVPESWIETFARFRKETFRKPKSKK